MEQQTSLTSLRAQRLFVAFANKSRVDLSRQLALSPASVPTERQGPKGTPGPRWVTEEDARVFRIALDPPTKAASGRKTHGSPTPPTPPPSPSNGPPSDSCSLGDHGSHSDADGTAADRVRCDGASEQGRTLAPTARPEDVTVGAFSTGACQLRLTVDPEKPDTDRRPSTPASIPAHWIHRWTKETTDEKGEKGEGGGGGGGQEQEGNGHDSDVGKEDDGNGDAEREAVTVAVPSREDTALAMATHWLAKAQALQAEAEVREAESVAILTSLLMDHASDPSVVDRAREAVGWPAVGVTEHVGALHRRRLSFCECSSRMRPRRRSSEGGEGELENGGVPRPVSSPMGSPRAVHPTARVVAADPESGRDSPAIRRLDDATDRNMRGGRRLLVGRSADSVRALLRELVTNKEEMWDVAALMGFDHDEADRFSDIVPPSCHHLDADVEALQRMVDAMAHETRSWNRGDDDSIETQSEAEVETRARALILLGDACFVDRELMASAAMRSVMMNARYLGIDLYAVCHYGHTVPRVFRSQIDLVVVVGNCTDQTVRRALWRSFFGVFDRFYGFESAMDLCCDGDRGAIAIDTRAGGSRTVSNMVYRLVVPPDLSGGRRNSPPIVREDIWRLHHVFAIEPEACPWGGCGGDVESSIPGLRRRYTNREEVGRATAAVDVLTMTPPGAAYRSTSEHDARVAKAAGGRGRHDESNEEEETEKEEEAEKEERQEVDEEKEASATEGLSEDRVRR